jgi:hypothetical protein
LLDWHDFHLPGDIAPGTYTIVVSIRDAADSRILSESDLCPITVLP